MAYPIEYYNALTQAQQQLRLSVAQAESARLERQQQMAATGNGGFLGGLLGTNDVWTAGTCAASADLIWDTGIDVDINSISFAPQRASLVTDTAPKPLTFLQQIRKEIDEWIHN